MDKTAETFLKKIIVFCRKKYILQVWNNMRDIEDTVNFQSYIIFVHAALWLEC